MYFSVSAPPRARFLPYILVKTYSEARDTTQKGGGRSRSRRGQWGGMLWGWAQGAGARMGGVSWQVGPIERLIWRRWNAPVCPLTRCALFRATPKGSKIACNFELAINY